VAVLQATLKVSKIVAPGLAITVSDEFPNPHKRGKVRFKSLYRLGFVFLQVRARIVLNKAAVRVARAHAPLEQSAQSTMQ
jgi:hypothetical protein